MTLEPLGEAALILRHLPLPAPAAAALLAASDLGFEDVVPCFDEVGLYLPRKAPLPTLSNIEAALNGSPTADGPYTHVIPVCYDLAQDQAEVSESLGISFDEIVQAHAEANYTCRAVGFCPGFGYLTSLPQKLCGLGRKVTPRIRVEPGSVALTGNMTAVYPLARPGGWQIVGRTPLTLVDVEDGYFPIRVGDSVRFISVSIDEFKAREGERL